MKLRVLTYVIAVVTMIMGGASLTSCHKTLEPTSVQIRDSIRHYYPVVLGDELSIECVITNLGDENLAITDIQPSNFSTVLTSSFPGIIPPGKSEILSFVFHTEKNVGLAQHTIRFFGNIEPEGVAELVFDTHIVRPTVDSFDYEEVYYREKQSELEILVDGERGQKGYWTDSEVEDSSFQRHYKKYLIY